MGIKRLTVEPERERRKIDKKTAKKIISESKDDFRKTIEEAFEAEAGITEFEFHLLTVLHDIKEELLKMEKVLLKMEKVIP